MKCRIKKAVAAAKPVVNLLTKPGFFATFYDADGNPLGVPFSAMRVTSDDGSEVVFQPAMFRSGSHGLEINSRTGTLEVNGQTVPVWIKSFVVFSAPRTERNAE